MTQTKSLTVKKGLRPCCVQLQAQHIISPGLRNVLCVADLATKNDMMKKCP